LGHHHRQSRRSKNRSRTLLQDTCLIKPTRALHDVLRRRVAGQDHAIDALVCSYGRSLSLRRDTERPLLTALLLGPTGVGKTETARAVAEALLGSEKALVRVSCEEYAHSHQIAKLLGSPPGYVGHDIEPLLSQRNLDRAVRQLDLPFLVQVSDGARDLIVDEGTDLRYGARPLRRTFERKLVEPLSRFFAAERLLPGDVVEVTRKGEELGFCRDRVEDVRGAA